MEVYIIYRVRSSRSENIVMCMVISLSEQSLLVKAIDFRLTWSLLLQGLLLGYCYKVVSFLMCIGMTIRT